MIIVDNTISSFEDLKNVELINFLQKQNFIIVGNNIGEKNKGLGELHMLKTICDSHDILQYKNITYITARRIFTCPYFFEKTELLSKPKQALLCNPDFLYLDGRFAESNKQNMYNDMIFSMTSDLMKKYADYSMDRVNYLTSVKKGSEQNLFDFVQENSIDFEWVKWIGLIRNDWEIDYKTSETKNFHIN